MDKLALGIVLTANDKTTPALTKAGSSLDKFAMKANAVGKSLTKIGVASVAMGGALLAPLKSTFTAYQDLAKAQGEVASLGIGQSGLDAITKSAREFSNQFAGTTASDFVRASYDIKSGISSLSDTAVGEFTKISAMTASATKSTTSEMTSLFATGFGIYRGQFESFGKSTIAGWDKLSAEEKDIKFGEYFSAGISGTVKAFKTDGANMSSALSNLGASATSAGVSFSEQLAILGTLQKTMSGSESATKYRAFLTSVAGAGDKLGLSFMDANNNLLPMVDIIGEIKAQYGETIDAVEAQELKKAFGTDEAVALVKMFYNETDNLASSITNMSGTLKDGTKSTLEMAKATNKGREFEVLSQKMGNVSTLIGQSFAPVALKLGNIIGGVVTKVGAWIEKNPELTSAITTGIAVVGGLAVALGTFAMVSGVVAMGMPMLATGIGFASSAFTFLGGVMATVGRIFLLNPIGLAVTAIAGLTYLLYDNWGAVSDWFSGLWDGIVGVFNYGIDIIKDYLGWTPLGMILNNWGLIESFFSNLWGNVTQIFSNTWTNIKSTFTGVVDFIKSPFVSFFDWISSKFEWISDIIGGTLGAITDIGGAITDKVSNTVGNIGDSIGNGLKTVSNWFKFGDDDETKSKTKIGSSVNNDTFKSTNKSLSLPKKAIASTVIASQLVAGQPSTTDIANYTNKTQSTQNQKRVEQKIQVNFGDIKVTTTDGKINNPQELQAQIQMAVEQALANANDTSLSDGV